MLSNRIGSPGRSWLVTAAVGLVAVASVGFSPWIGGTPRWHREQSPSPEPPNILIIVTDDQREGLHVMPRTRRHFHREGVRFDDAFATTPLCCPSRASIFTGRYTHNHRVNSNRWRSGVSRYDPAGSLPRLLGDAGYRTALIGKYFNGWPLESPPHEFRDFLTTQGDPYYGGWWNRNGKVSWDDRYSTSVIADAAVDFIKERAGVGGREGKEEPWFLHIAPIAPHAPFVPEKRYASADVGSWMPNPAHDEDAERGKPPFVRARNATFRKGAAMRTAQLRTLKSVDDLVGRVFDALKETGQNRDTLAFFISDNGMMYGEYGLMKKRFPYTPSVKVPMMMRWPARIRGGEVDDRLVGNIDIAPTVLDAAGVNTARGHPMDGRSLLNQRWSRDRILLELWRKTKKRQPWISTRTKDWQYIEHYDNDNEVYFRELYDLQRDPWQLENLLWKRDPPEEAPLTTLQRALQHDQKCRGTSGPSRCP